MKKEKQDFEIRSSLSEAWYIALCAVAAEEDRSMADAIRHAVKTYIRGRKLDHLSQDNDSPDSGNSAY